MPHSQVRHGSGGITDDHQGIETTGTAREQEYRASATRAAGIDLDALRAARERATLETMPMQNMPADAFARAAYGAAGRLMTGNETFAATALQSG